MKKRILKNFFSLFAGQALSQAVMFFVLIYVARVLGPRGLGKIGFAQVFTGYFLFLTDMGLGLLGIREIARDRSKIPEFVNSILSIKMVLACVFFTVLITIDLLMGKPGDIKTLIFIYGLVIFFYAGALDWLFLGTEKMVLTGVVNTLRAVTFLSLVLVFVRQSDDIFKVAGFFFFSYLISTLFYFALAKRFLSYSFRFRFNVEVWKKLLAQALPLGALTMLSVFMQQQSVLVLGFYGTPEDVGLYYGIYKIIFVVLFVTNMYGDTMLPIFSSIEGRKPLYFSMKLIAVTTAAAIVTATLFGNVIISHVLGAKYMAGMRCFSILLWTLPLSAFIAIFTKAMIAYKLDWHCVRGFAIGLATSVVTSLYLIPRFGLEGAAFSSVASLSVTAMYNGYHALKVVNLPAREAGIEAKEPAEASNAR